MVRRLDAGTTTIWNRSRPIVEELMQDGYIAMPNVAQGVAKADVVITMLRDQDAVRQVGEAGLYEALGPGKVWIDMTTGSPKAGESFAALSASKGAQFVAAPVLGTLGPAEKGTLVVLAGGSATALKDLDGILERFGSVRVCPGVREALVMKLLVNTLLASYMDAVSELMVLADAEHVSRDLVLDLMQKSSIAAPVLTGKGSRWKEANYRRAEFPIALLAKDLRLTLADALENQLLLPGVQSLVTLYEKASQTGGDLDMSGVGEVLAHPL